MQSVVLDIQHQRLEEREIPEPCLKQESDVLFRIHEVGVCGTDRELVTFRLPRPEKDVAALVIGHEALGQVIETGPAVTGLKPGDWVVPMVRRPCPALCRSCARGRTDLCLTNQYSERGLFGADGYFTQMAVDDARYLTRIPEHMLPYAILMEPLSVVEKAIGRAIAIRQTEENAALVLGLGPVGMLSALVLQARGYRVTLLSQEPADHPRAALLRRHGIEYSTQLEGRFDIILEAAGSAALAISAIRHLGPAGIFITLGARQVTAEFSFIDLIVGNQTIIGSVNASPEAFETALSDLGLIPASALTAMIRRFNFQDYRRTLFDTPGTEPKFVHRMA